VATTPFTLEVIIPEAAEMLLELIIEEVEVIPLTIEVRVFTVEDKSF
jgi:hypothetical protein